MRFIYKKGSKILTNKYFLYFVFIITIIYLFQLILAKKINLIILFGLISYIVYCFNKNMAIVLGVSLIITYITTLGMRVKEGFDTATASADKTAAQTTISADKTAIATNNPTLVSDKNNVTASDSTSGTLSNIVNNAKSKIQSTLGTTTQPTTTESTTTESTTTEPVSTESMNVMSNKKRNRIDYASTVQDAYEDLNSMLGEDGIKGLTLDTNKLIEQQAQLASAMKNMTPLVKTAKELLNGFNFEGMNDISNMAKQFMPSK